MKGRTNRIFVICASAMIIFGIIPMKADASPTYYGGIFGGGGNTYGESIAVDSNGNIFITGSTSANNTTFPLKNASDDSLGGSWDAFVGKLMPNLIDFVYLTYLGGNSSDFGRGIAIDSNGNVYVTGYTNSDDFPTTSGAYDTTLNGNSYDVFVTKLDSSGSIVYSTYIGGNESDYGYDIAQYDNCAYVVGDTFSSNFPVSDDAYDQSLNGTRDAFVTKLDSLGQGVVYSTYLGGIGDDYGRGIAMGVADVYVTGFTNSSDFPTTVNAYDTSYNHASGSFLFDAFVTKLNLTTTIYYSTYLGGSGDDMGYGIIVDSSIEWSAFVTGTTNSTNFPTTTGAYTTSLQGYWDAFVTKLNKTGSSLNYSTYLGGSGTGNGEKGLSIAVNLTGNNAILTGVTDSDDFPTTDDALDPTFNGSLDAFVTVLNYNGSGIVYSSYLGGEGNDQGNDIAARVTGDVYVTGRTSSDDFPTHEDTNLDQPGPNVDGFVSRFETL
jgi:hypothetical protein